MNKMSSTSFYVALLLLLVLLLIGCEQQVLQFKVDNQSDQPVVVSYREYHKGEWGPTETRGPSDPDWYSWPVNWREPLDAQFKYYFEVKTVNGEVICSWEFAHDQIKGMEVVLVVPSCESYEEGKPWRGVFGWLFEE